MEEHYAGLKILLKEIDIRSQMPSGRVLSSHASGRQLKSGLVYFPMGGQRVGSATEKHFVSWFSISPETGKLPAANLACS